MRTLDTRGEAMVTTFRPMSSRRLKELRGYVAWGTAAFRAVLFALAITIAGRMLWALHRLLPEGLRHPVWWLVPTVAFAVFLHVRSRRWTGGPGFRGRVRADLAGGVAACHLVRAVDAVEFEESGDAGPVFFVLTDAGQTFAFSGQYLARYKAKGFPWREFEVMEAPSSKVFFGLKAIGEPLEPSAKHPPLPWDAYKQLLSGAREYAIVNVAFEGLKEGRITSFVP